MRTISLNVIAECMYAQVDSKGNQYQLLSNNTEHRSDNSVIQINDGFITDRNGIVLQSQPPKAGLC